MATAATLLHDRLIEQQADLVVAEDAVRRGEPDGIHDLRVAMRRIRSALATFRPLVDTSVTEPLRDELRWASGRLGEARDAEVVAERIVTLLDEVSGDTPDSVVERLRHRVRADADAVQDLVPETIDGHRYAAALVLLGAVVAQPPWTGKAEAKARKTARKRVRREARHVLRLADEANQSSDPAERAERLHTVRKRAKRLRYAGETAEPVLGGRARAVAEAAEQIQTTLGDHHDDVVTRAALRRIAEADDGDEASAFLLGRLDVLEQQAADRLERRAAEDLCRLEKVVAKKFGHPGG